MSTEGFVSRDIERDGTIDDEGGAVDAEEGVGRIWEEGHARKIRIHRSIQAAASKGDRAASKRRLVAVNLHFWSHCVSAACNSTDTDCCDGSSANRGNGFCLDNGTFTGIFANRHGRHSGVARTTINDGVTCDHATRNIRFDLSKAGRGCRTGDIHGASSEAGAPAVCILGTETHGACTRLIDAVISRCFQHDGIDGQGGPCPDVEIPSV